jgi:hypothetical protein
MEQICEETKKVIVEQKHDYKGNKTIGKEQKFRP